MSVFIYPQQQITISGVATEATLLLVEQNTADTVTELVAANASLDSLETLVLTGAQLRTTHVRVAGPLTDTELRASAVPVYAASLPLPTGAATETTLAAVQYAADALNARTAGSLTPVEFDEQAITFLLAGNGIGGISPVVNKLATVPVATLTMSYDANDRLSGELRA